MATTTSDCTASSSYVAKQACASGACVFELNPLAPGLTPLPFAKTVNGQALTYLEPLEAAVDAGSIQLFDPRAVIVGTINQNN